MTATLLDTENLAIILSTSLLSLCPTPEADLDTSHSGEARTAVPGDAVTPLIVVGNSCKSAVYVGNIAI